MDPKIVDLDKQVRKAFFAVKNDIKTLMQFKEGISKATVKNKKIFSNIIKAIDQKIKDSSKRIADIDTAIKTFEGNFKKIEDELYRGNVDIQKLQLEQAKLVKFKNAVAEQAKIKNDLYEIVEKFELQFKEVESIKKLFGKLEKTNFDDTTKLKAKVDGFEKTLRDLVDAVNDKMHEIEDRASRMDDKSEMLRTNLVSKPELADEMKGISRKYSDALNQVYAKNVMPLEKDFSTFKQELKDLKRENTELKTKLANAGSAINQLANESVSKQSFMSFQQENFNNTIKVTNLLKDSFKHSLKQIHDKLKEFAKEQRLLVEQMYKQVYKIEDNVVDKKKFEKAMGEINKTIFKYYKANLELTKLDVSYSGSDARKSKSFFEKLFSYDELDEQKHNIENINFDQPPVNIKPVEVKVAPIKGVESTNNVVPQEVSLPTEKKSGGFFRFVTNLFFDEVDVEEPVEEKAESKEIVDAKSDDMIVDLTDKVESVEQEPVIEKPKVKKTVKKKSSKKTVKKKSSKKTVKKKVKKKKRSRKYDDGPEVINLYD